MPPSLLLLTLAGAATAFLLRAQQRQKQELAALRLSMQRVAAFIVEGARAQAQLDALREVQDAAEKSVHLGASAVRALHLGIAAIPFGILEAIPATRPGSRAVKAVHDGVTNAVYDSITGTNKLLGSVLRQKLTKQGQAAGEPSKKPGKDPRGS